MSFSPSSQASSASGPIARRLLRAWARFKNQNVIDLAAVRAGKEEAERLVASVPDRSPDADPAHAVYASAYNLVSILAESLTALPALASFADLISAAQEQYMPSWPPMSPISESHFGTWAFFDLALGEARETLGTCILALAPALRLPGDVVRLIGTLQHSRLGLFVHEGNVNRGSFILREMMTGERFRAVCPSGYVGRAGEQWLVRLLPPPSSHFEEYVAFTSPYIIELPGESEWRSFFHRTIPKTKLDDDKAAYESLMKYGLSLNYWNEYIFEGYWQHSDHMIALLGVPDIEASRPHSNGSAGDSARLRHHYGAALRG